MKFCIQTYTVAKPKAEGGVMRDLYLYTCTLRQRFAGTLLLPRQM